METAAADEGAIAHGITADPGQHNHGKAAGMMFGSKIKSAKTNEDGSFTIHFGGDPKSVNCLPITKGWSYAVRIYQPRKEILDGSWKFPKIEPVK